MAGLYRKILCCLRWIILNFLIHPPGNRLRAQFTAQKEAQEKKAALIRDELQEEILTRAKSAEILSRTIVEEIQRVELAVDREVKEREHADNELVGTIGHYTAALQDAVKIVSAT